MPAADSYKHKKSSRVLIPSHEEAGAEDASPKVVGAPGRAEIPKNPVVRRGQDPELFWLGKYGADDSDDILRTDIRSLYRHEHIAPEKIISGLYRLTEGGRLAEEQMELSFDVAATFGNAITRDDLEKVSGYYTHSDGWTNRLTQGDSLLVMSSLLHREGMAGSVQCFYFDPPYGIKYGSNWQIKLNSRTVTDGKDEDLSGEPEQIKAFRDTWELGIHSYLSYLRDRLLLARDLLHESGSCFVQISDENVHLVRCLMDEVFGAENFAALIFLKKTGGLGSGSLKSVADYLIWYAKDIKQMKYRALYKPKELGKGESTGERYDQLESPDRKERRPMTREERDNTNLVPKGWRAYQLDNLTSGAFRKNTTVDYTFAGETFHPGANACWKTTVQGLDRLAAAGRIQKAGGTLRYKRYLEDFPAIEVTNLWDDVAGAADKAYVVQTSTSVSERCILMTTDPGDLVLDPTCGSGTTAYVAEQWGRRWITCDTSRIALNIAKTRLLTATFPYYRLHDAGGDVRQGFIYKKVKHVTLGSIANNEPAAEETLYDQPETDNKRLRVAGAFTVETLQNFEPQSPDSMRPANAGESAEDLERFEANIFAHLQSAGIKTGDKRENAVFHHVEPLASTALNAMGYYRGEGDTERKAYLHIGPKFGTVSKKAVNDAIKECRQRGDAEWLIILGFSFESDIENRSVDHAPDKVKHYNLGSFQVTKVRMHDDLMQEGLIKKDKKAASFVTIGEPDIRVERTGLGVVVEIAGLDIYDPIKDLVKSRDVEDIAYWMLDTDYDGSNFVPRQIFFCGGDKDEFEDWRKGLTKLSEQRTRARAERTLRVELDEDAFARLYGHRSHPLPKFKDGQRLAVRVVSQFGEETTKVITLDPQKLAPVAVKEATYTKVPSKPKKK